jgi:preprotein translocase subunit SecA
MEERLQAARGARRGAAGAIGPEQMRDLEKGFLLQMIDMQWREHLMHLDHLRQVIGLRGYGQRDPLNEYKTEAFSLFEKMLGRPAPERHPLADDGGVPLRAAAEMPDFPGDPPQPADRRERDGQPGRPAAGAGSGRRPAADAARGAAARRLAHTPAQHGVARAAQGRKFKHCHGAFA